MEQSVFLMGFPAQRGPKVSGAATRDPALSEDVLYPGHLNPPRKWIDSGSTHQTGGRSADQSHAPKLHTSLPPNTFLAC